MDNLGIAIAFFYHYLSPFIRSKWTGLFSFGNCVCNFIIIPVHLQEWGGVGLRGISGVAFCFSFSLFILPPPGLRDAFFLPLLSSFLLPLPGGPSCRPHAAALLCLSDLLFVPSTSASALPILRWSCTVPPGTLTAAASPPR